MNVSVIIPAFNAEKTISETINSVLKQKTSFKFEILVIDDGSKDNTINEITKFGNQIKIISNKNKGPAFARNLGAKNANGEIIVFIDADCIAGKNWLEEMIKPFSDKKIAGVQGAYKTKQTELIAKFVQIEIEHRYKRMGKTNSLDWIGSYSAAYRKKIFLQEQGFDLDFKKASGEDPELSYKLAKKGFKLKFNPLANVFHKHPTSLTDYLTRKYKHAFWRVLLYKKHTDKAINDSYTPQTLKLQIILIGIILISSIINLIFSQTTYLTTLIILTYIISLIPFTIFALRKNLTIGIITPIIITLRNSAFILGLIMGTLKGMWKK